jgi:hypothetical protein
VIFYTRALARRRRQWEGLTIVYLNCPHCGLTITPKADWLAVEHCPRCIARRGVLVTLFASSLPVDSLYHEESRPDRGRGRPADAHPAPTT